MNLQEQNWTNLFGERTLKDTAWHGTWTKYSPDKEVINCFQGVRRFRANEDKTLIYQTNNYTYSDGSTEEKNWQLEKQTCNQPDGVIHVAQSSMRALSLGQGAVAWLSKTLEPGKDLGCELFLKHENWRTSVAILYGENSNLKRITHIREHLDSFPVEPPSSEVQELNGKWVGEKKSITSNLKVSDIEPTQELLLDPTKGINKTIFFPDGVVVNVPESLKVSQEFKIVAGRFVSENDFKRLTAKYDSFGNFQLLISEVFHRH